MIVWFVIPAVNEAAFRAIYDNEHVRSERKTDLGVDERIGKMVVGEAGNLMTGTSRMSDAARRALDGRKPPWLEIFTKFPPLSTWKPRDQP